MSEVVKILPPQGQPLQQITCSVKQAAEITSLSTRKIYALIADGRLKTVQFDGRRLIYVSSVRALLPDG